MRIQIEGAKSLRWHWSGVKLLAIILLFCPELQMTSGGLPPLTIEKEPSRPRKNSSCILPVCVDFGFDLELGSNPSLTPDDSGSESGFRLPGDVQPILYNLKIMPILDVAPPNFKEWTSQGSLSIFVEVLNATSTIRMHKDKNLVHVEDKDISILDSSTGQQMGFLNSGYDDAGLWTLYTSAALVAGGRYEIRIETFSGIIPASDTGLYRASYKDSTGQTNFLATTQFSAIGFRKMMPGFDEPRFKAQFIVSIARLTTHMTLSNSNVSEEGVSDPTLPDGYVWDHYEPTVTMSSYIFAILVANYTFVPADASAFDKPVRVYGPREMIEAGGGNYTAYTSSNLLKTFEDLFNQTYPMPKLDSISIPKEMYHFSAMENYGHITYRDDVVMYFPGESLETSRARSVNVVAHEVAHHWFGNLVTPFWWNFVWLKEGFATFGSFLGMETVAPEYDPQSKMMYDEVHLAQYRDTTSASHPVVQFVGEEQVNAMSFFDFIAYEKGASLIRMMEGFLGREILLKGMRKYLAAKKFDNAVQDDLFEALDQAAAEEGQSLPQGLTVKTVMDTYTLQKGLPLVRVSQADSNRIYISQERYRENLKLPITNLDPDELWEVPVAITTESQPNFLNHTPALWLHKNISLTSYAVDTSQWLIVNPEGYGYYRTMYDTPLLTLIKQQLNSNHTVISPRAKSQLLEDYTRFAEQEYIRYETALDLTKFLGSFSTDFDHVFWYPAIGLFSRIYTLFSNTDALPHFQRYLIPKLEAALNHLTWNQAPGEHGIRVILRALLLDWSCALGNDKCAEVTEEWFDHWLLQQNSTFNPIPPDLQSIVFCSAVALGNKNAFPIIFEEFTKERRETQKTRLFNALSCAQTEEELLQLLSNSMTADFENLTSTLLMNVAKNSMGRGVLQEFVNKNWTQLVNHTATDPAKIETKIIPIVVSSLITYQSSSQDLINLNNLIKDIEQKRPDHYAYIERELKACIFLLELNMKWMKQNFEPIKTWLVNNS